MNRAAAAQEKEGDNEAIPAITEESGIGREDAMDFIDGYVVALMTSLTTAYGELDIETKELKPYETTEDWPQYTKLRYAEEPGMAVAIRRKGKSLKGCITALLEWSMKNQHPVDSGILKTVKIDYKVTLEILRMGRAKGTITEYYMRREQ